MKKYVKPELFYECYELSQHIAVCALDMFNSVSVQNCTASGTIEGLGPVTNGFLAQPACAEPTEVYCYTNGGPGMNIFRS